MRLEEKFIGKRHELETREFLLDKIKPDMCVIDVGAGTGLYTYIFSKLVGPSGMVHAFEPDPSRVAVLERLVDEFSLKNVRINPLGLSNKRGMGVQILSPTLGAGTSKVELADTIECRTIELISLDEYFIEPPDFMKIDVEGAEFEVLLGGRRVLEKGTEIILELHEDLLRLLGYRVEDLFDFLRGLNYSFTKLSGSHYYISR